MASPISPSNVTPSSALTQVMPSLPRNPQSSNRLMHLLAELRVMVLHDLLARPRSIFSRYTDDHPFMVHNKQRERGVKGRFIKRIRSSSVSDHRLTPAILSTCQYLFNEAIHILYHEKILRLDISMQWNRRTYNFGVRSLRDICVTFSMLDSEDILYYRDQEQGLDTGLPRVARRFRNFLVVIGQNPDPLHLIQLRTFLQFLSPVFTS